MSIAEKKWKSLPVFITFVITLLWLTAGLSVHFDPMRKNIFLILLIALTLPAVAQKKGGPGGRGHRTMGSFFSQKDRAHAKYFIALSYGAGKSWWNSHLGNAEIYDHYGAIVKSGTIDFKARNNTNSICLDGSVPVAKVRLGLGINFDYYFLDKLELTDLGYVLYDESFRFDKFFLSCEVPFNFESDRQWSLSAKAHLGYFGFSYVDHFSLFGDEALAKTYFGTLGVVGDIKLYPHSYLFIFPNMEFKYYDNNNSENPVQIHHNIFGICCMAGIRIDVSREK